MRYREFVLSPYGVIKIKSLGYTLSLLSLIVQKIDALHRYRSSSLHRYIARLLVNTLRAWSMDSDLLLLNAQQRQQRSGFSF
ncbi:hypothetical protein [Symbiopectobacterium purcellii]|uniref:hypothetical protein n=1 Tax=Symbiopectobacterium purcellii TaxID=2871826 RepID=UPI003F829C9C